MISSELVAQFSDQIVPHFYGETFADLQIKSEEGQFGVTEVDIVRAMVEDLLVTESRFRQSIPWQDGVAYLTSKGLTQGTAEYALQTSRITGSWRSSTTKAPGESS